MQTSHLLLDRPWQYDKRVINDGLKNRYSFEMKERPINVLSLTPKQTYEEQLKLKKKKIAENESLYIKRTFFANKVFLEFDDDDVIL